MSCIYVYSGLNVGRCKCGVRVLVCFAPSTEGFGSRNIISTIQFGERKRDVGGKIVKKEEIDTVPVEEVGRQRPGKIPVK